MTDFVTTTQASKMRSGIDLEAVVTKIGDRRTVNLKSGGTVDVADAILSDDTGDIALALWDEDIAKVQTGSKVTILNGYTNEFKGQVSLTKGKFGTMEVE
jgi:replication factor A1